MDRRLPPPQPRPALFFLAVVLAIMAGIILLA